MCGHLHCYYPSVDYDPPFETALYWMENPQSPWDSTISRTYEWPLELMQLGRLEVNNNPPGYETYLSQYMAVYTALSFIMTASTDKPGYQWSGDPAASGTGQASIHLSATPPAGRCPRAGQHDAGVGSPGRNHSRATPQAEARGRPGARLRSTRHGCGLHRSKPPGNRQLPNVWGYPQ